MVFSPSACVFLERFCVCVFGANTVPMFSVILKFNVKGSLLFSISRKNIPIMEADRPNG